ncbi:4-hydroxy-3-methylbut-2-enyl diphosphate reductase [Phytoactinopolyspora halophila]|nr:4-hydroxy-3-methylbut-2-enyl diphosphate reductase [Phytoactinopolyspora halophila]
MTAHRSVRDAGTVLVADALHGLEPDVIPCPAAEFVAGELRRREIAATIAPLHLDPAGASDSDVVEFTAVLDGTDGRAGLGLAASRVPEASGIRQAASDALARWAAVAQPRTVLLASPRSFCAGVERAIDVVWRLLEQRGGPIYVRKQIVHNTHVVSELEEHGAVFVDELDSVPEGATVVFSAHGVSPEVRAEAQRRGLDAIDATCPLVTKVHSEARRFANRGDTVVLIGHAGHEEVEGTLGEAPGETVLVEDAADVENLAVDDPSRVSYLTQTTLAVDETTEVLEALRDRFPDLRGPASDDICYASTNRQDALKVIAEESDLVLVVGSDNSSNSLRLVELAHRYGTPAYLVDDAGDIRAEWLSGVDVVGLTAGASAPSRLTEEIITALGGLGPVTVRERKTVEETVEFNLPSAVRP